MEPDPFRNRKKSGLDLSLHSWLGRSFLLAGTVQVAVVCTCLVLSEGNIGSALFLAFLIPLSWAFFPTGLAYLMKPIPNSYLLALLAYLSLLIPAVLSHERAVFFILYAILVLLLIANATGCAVMPPFRYSDP